MRRLTMRAAGGIGQAAATAALRLAPAVRWPALVGLYLALAGQATPAEIVAGLLAGTAAAGFSILLLSASGPVLRLRAPWPRIIARLARSIGGDVGRVGFALAQAVATGNGGRVTRRKVARTHVGPRESGHRALVMLLASVAPNGYVLEASGAALRLHRLARAAPPGDAQWPI